MGVELTLRPTSEILADRGLGPPGNRAQMFIDNEVLRLCDPLVPLDTGALKDSGIRSTNIGSGLVIYSTPYAEIQYYETAQTRSYDPNRGSFWFERMKAQHKDAILNGAKKITGAV